MNTRLIAVLCAGIFTCLAHPLGNFSVSHYTRFHVTAQGVTVIYALDFAEVPTQQLQRAWGALTPEKADEAMREWTAKLQFTSRGQAVDAFHEGTELTLGEGAGGLKVARVTASLRLPGRLGELHYEDSNFPGRPGWKEIVISEEAPARVTRASHSARDLSRALTRYPLEQKPPHDLRAQLAWTLEAGPAGATRVITPLAQPAAPAMDAARDGTEGQDRLSQLLSQPELPWNLLLLALALAFGLGALHALEPGHGKTIVAAYLVGTRGTWQHAVYLGAIVTFTHTFTVFVLGLAVLFASQYWSPERIFPVLSLTSGASVLGLGLWMLYQRWREARGGGNGRLHRQGPHGHPHRHGPGQHHHAHQHLPPDRVTLASLWTLGVSGGLVPCPAALVMLLACTGMGRIALGLSLLVSFSLGLALVLTAIGLLVVYAKNRLPRRAGPESPWLRYAPVVSALVITLIGAALTAQALGWRG